MEPNKPLDLSSLEGFALSSSINDRMCDGLGTVEALAVLTTQGRGVFYKMLLSALGYHYEGEPETTILEEVFYRNQVIPTYFEKTKLLRYIDTRHGRIHLDESLDDNGYMLAVLEITKPVRMEA